ncbi:amidohydrolase family protein [Amycolatopsis sp. GM8]|uniref:amidohydrolase family protein n=1 Tax=Amycolatopsis sp. GM8 TaxID=2896530 RepID=UPI001F31989B|nr:amidohydrolase family protein [Amycolatopsis sp. GM8]
MIVDTHQHYAPPTMLAAAVAERPEVHGYLGGEVTTLDDRVGELDRAGVDVAVLSMPPPGPLLDPGDDLPRYRELLSRANDELLAGADRRPDRFRAMVCLPFGDPDPQACVTELERVRDHPLVRGVVAFANTTGPALDAAEPVHQAIASYGLPLQVHPQFGDLAHHAIFDGFTLGGSLAMMLESSAVVARMMLSGLLDRVPDLTLVVPHLGGVLPYVAQRLIDLSGTGQAREDCAYYLRERCLLDTCSFHPPALRCAVETVTAEKIMLGSDYPQRGRLARAVDDIRTSTLRENERRAILGGNAVRAGLT